MPRTEPARRTAPIALVTALLAALVVLAFAGGRRVADRGGGPPSVMPAAATAVPTPKPAPAEIPGTPPDSGTAVAGAPVPTVCLDPGHGGPDRGAVGESGGVALDEADLVLDYALALERRLIERGLRVALTRRTDAAANPDGADINGDGRTIADDPPWPAAKTNWTLDDLQARIDACNAAGADLLVSMHVNANPNNPASRGYEVWYTRERAFGQDSRRFADLAYAHLKERLGGIGYVLAPEEERGVFPDSTANVPSEQARFENFVVTGPAVAGAVDPSRMPGAIVETLFLSNAGDAFALLDPGGRDAIVRAYEDAIAEFFIEQP